MHVHIFCLVDVVYLLHMCVQPCGVDLQPSQRGGSDVYKTRIETAITEIWAHTLEYDAEGNGLSIARREAVRNTTTGHRLTHAHCG